MYKHKRATIRLLFTHQTGHITMQGQTLCDTRILRPGSLCISFFLVAKGTPEPASLAPKYVLILTVFINSNCY